ncbi:hypothetical protein [Streptomyces sp. NPDC047071]|uniref:hypothetical protein n=1 Tax=Streptomyces sp. NPDC047071 TaxID=3154808 RepID=UPI0034563D0F
MPSSPPTPHETAATSPGNRTETVLGTLLLIAFVGFLFLFVADARHDDTLATVGRALHWASGAGTLVTIVLSRTVLRRWRSGFDWIFAALWCVRTILMCLNGEL